MKDITITDGMRTVYTIVPGPMDIVLTKFDMEIIDALFLAYPTSARIKSVRYLRQRFTPNLSLAHAIRIIDHYRSATEDN